MSVSLQYLANAGAQAISRALSVGANLASLIIVARVLGADTFGQYAFIMAWVNIASSLADLGTTSVLSRDLAQQVDRRPELYFGNYLYVRAVVTLAATLLAAIAVPLFKPDFMGPLLLCSLAIPVVASRFFEPVYQVFGQPRYSIYASLWYGLSLLILSVALLVWLRLSLLHFLIGWVASNALYTVVAFRLSARLIRPRFDVDREVIRRIAVLAAPLGVGALFSILHTRADVFVLGYLRSMQEVGHYSAAYKLLDMGSIMAITLLWPLIPILSRKFSLDHASGQSLARRILELSALVSLPVAIIGRYVAGPVIQLVYGPEYADSARVVRILSTVFVILVFALVGVVTNLSVGRIKHAYWTTALAVTVNLSLNFVLIPSYGITGAAWATLASHLCMLLVQQGFVFRNVGNLFRAGYWVRVIGLNAALWLILRGVAGDDLLYLLPVVTVLYYLAAYLLGMLPGRRAPGLSG